MPDIRTPLLLNQNEIRGAVIQVLGAAPSSPAVGQLYYNSTRPGVQYWNGTAWANYATNSDQLGGQTLTQVLNTAKGYSLDQFAAPAANVAMGGFRLTGVADPTGAQDGATKNYVDTVVQSAAAGIDSKPSVRLVATAAIGSLSGLSKLIDGVGNPLSGGDRILLTAQADSTQNGVWLAAGGSWTRAVDADQTGELTPGAFWYVEEGTAYGKSQWRIQNTGAITLGTTAITINQFGQQLNYLAGNGLALASLTFSVVAQPGIVVTASGVGVDFTVVPGKYSTTIGDGSSTSFTVTHGLGTRDVVVGFRDVSTNAGFLADWVATSTSAITVTISPAPATSGVRVTVLA